MKKQILLTAMLVTLVIAFSSAGRVTAADIEVDLSPMEQLGKELFFDKISEPGWMACATCHAPKAGWTGPIAGINQRWTRKFGQVAKVVSRRERRSLECHARGSSIRLS